MMMSECHICDRGCEGQTGKMCFSCGLPSCGTCSLVLNYYEFGDKRICNNCITSHYDNGEEIVEWNQLVNAGYDPGPMPHLWQRGRPTTTYDVGEVPGVEVIET